MTPTVEPLAGVVDGLDEAQRRAVNATEGPVLLIAGLGAGKTLTLVRRTLHICPAVSRNPTRSAYTRLSNAQDEPTGAVAGGIEPRP